MTTGPKKRSRTDAEPLPPNSKRQQVLQAEREKLPIWSARDKLLQEVARNSTLVVVGETGSGKTTQIPQFLYHAGYCDSGIIACTQPRRVAAVTVARRVAEELGVQLGNEVGYSIRFDDTTSPLTRIKYLTDGMLLREAILDSQLTRYKVVIVDEAHERTVQTDVLLGLLKKVQAQRKDDFRLIVMSATLDANKFVDYFGSARAAYIQGRQHPVKVLYTAQPQANYLEAVLTATLQIHSDEPEGDILVFLTGQEEIESAERMLRERAAQLPPGPAQLQLLVTPIYAALPPDQQMKVFEPAPAGHRKAILATNIAETSITIGGVRYVVDAGFVKARGYNARLGVDSLQVVPISQAQARQRSGRAGREAPGKAFRLYTEASFLQLPAATLPEIQRSNLASVVLQLKALGIADPLNFDFMDPPPRAALVRSLELLLALGALSRDGSLTDPVGTQMARLPVEPMFGRVLLASCAMGCGQEAVAVVAMVSAEGVFLTPRDKREAAAEARRRFTHKDGDHLTLLAVHRAFCEVSRKEQAQWCSDAFLNVRALRKAVDIQQQLTGQLQQLQLPLRSCGDDLNQLRRALVCGLFPNSAKRQPDNAYRVIATGQQVFLHPSSVLCGKRPDYLLFNELVRTSKHYVRDLCTIEAEWLPELAPAFFTAKAAAAATVHAQ